jgi:CRP-like cAMP-binding protein
MEILEYKKGENIIEQNEIGDAFFVIESGRVKVVVSIGV